MAYKFNYCPGCDGKEDDRKTPGDHMHQYIGGTGNTTMVYFIDGIAYTSPSEAEEYLMGILECDRREAITYMQKLAKAYT